MRGTILSVAVSAFCLAGAGPSLHYSAQRSSQDPVQPVPRFRSGVDLVVLDVSVLDRNRIPVRGLTAADFTILEDGKPQELGSFSAIDLPDTERTEKTEAFPDWMRDVAPDVRTNDSYSTDRGVFVIVMDDATPMPKEDIAYAKKWARSIVERLGPGATAAVVYTFNKSAGQEFTEDRARLFAAIDRFNGSIDSLEQGVNGIRVPFDRFATSAATLYRLAVGTLRDVAERLVELPQRRKALVFVSVGVPLDIGLNAPQLIGDLEASSVAEGDVIQHLLRDLHQTFRAAQQANVNIYSLDPGGLRAPVVVRSPLAGTSRLEGNPGLLNREFLMTVSESTGGFAVTNTNDASAGITQMIRENASYYLLGYRPSDARAEGKYRRIEVKVNRAGVTVRARHGYYEPRSGTADLESVASKDSFTSLERALRAPLPSIGMSLRVAAAPFALTVAREAGVAIVLGVREPTEAGIDWPAVDKAEVLSYAFDVKGRDVASERISAAFALRPNSLGEAAYEVLSLLQLKPGRYHLRLAAESAIQGKSGSVYCDVEVPDFWKLPLSLSGVAISATGGPASAPNDKMAALLPVAPTAEREFNAGARVAAFLRVYQGGDDPPVPVTLIATLRDARGAIVFERADDLRPDRFSQARSADFHVDLPLARLKAGEYLLTIEASYGNRKARRDVRLAIR